MALKVIQGHCETSSFPNIVVMYCVNW